ncbi:hypothetical protein Q5752_000599 [Cryptotrichosporon argae]
MDTRNTSTESSWVALSPNSTGEDAFLLSSSDSLQYSFPDDNALYMGTPASFERVAIKAGAGTGASAGVSTAPALANSMRITPLTPITPPNPFFPSAQRTAPTRLRSIGLPPVDTGMPLQRSSSYSLVAAAAQSSRTALGSSAVLNLPFGGLSLDQGYDFTRPTIWSPEAVKTTSHDSSSDDETALRRDNMQLEQALIQSQKLNALYLNKIHELSAQLLLYRSGITDDFAPSFIHRAYGSPYGLGLDGAVIEYLTRGTSLILANFDQDVACKMIRPMVWTVAFVPVDRSQASIERFGASNMVGTALKHNAGQLGQVLGQTAWAEASQRVVDSMCEWGTALCSTPSGNYLCQQLLDRGTLNEKRRFIEGIQKDLLSIATSKYGVHVLTKAIGMKELQDMLFATLLEIGVFETLSTPAKKVWDPFLISCKITGHVEVFDILRSRMKGRWADLAIANECGTLAVQMIFEGGGDDLLMHEVHAELMADLARVANNRYGHFAIGKLIGYQSPAATHIPHTTQPITGAFIDSTREAILMAHPPVAVQQNGVTLVESVITSGRGVYREAVARYFDALCSSKDGHVPGIVTVAALALGESHIRKYLCMEPHYSPIRRKVCDVCRNYQTTIRGTKAGNKLLQDLGIVPTPNAHRFAPRDCV